MRPPQEHFLLSEYPPRDHGGRTGRQMMFVTVISTIAAPNNSEQRPCAERKENSQMTVTFAIYGFISGDGVVGIVLAKQEHEYIACVGRAL